MKNNYRNILAIFWNVTDQNRTQLIMNLRLCFFWIIKRVFQNIPSTVIRFMIVAICPWTDYLSFNYFPCEKLLWRPQSEGKRLETGQQFGTHCVEWEVPLYFISLSSSYLSFHPFIRFFKALSNSIYVFVPPLFACFHQTLVMSRCLNVTSDCEDMTQCVYLVVLSVLQEQRQVETSWEAKQVRNAQRQTTKLINMYRKHTCSSYWA